VCSSDLEEEFWGAYEDQAFYAKVYLKEPVFVANEVWARYRQHPNSTWHVAQKMGQHLSARRFFLDWLEEYLLEQGVEDAEVWKLLREEQLIVQVRVDVRSPEWKRAMRGLLVLVCYHPRGFVRGFARAYKKLRLHVQLRRRLF
jgi:hypothetical protein